MTFSFSFGGDDIEETADDFKALSISPPAQAAETGSLARRPSSSTAFPVSGQSLIPAASHAVKELLEALPSAISYGTLTVVLDDGSEVKIPRRELWDVRAQIMAEDAEGQEGLGKDDVKTGVYEGGFKSWESSVDLVKELAKEKKKASRYLELGCGTALPTLAVLQWHMAEKHGESKLDLAFADYNASVLRLVTLPNVLLSWAQSLPHTEETGPWEEEGELDIDADLLEAFQADLADRKISLSFFSGAWGEDFEALVDAAPKRADGELLIIGAETIYSPAALKSFADVLANILKKEAGGRALVGAKKVYFGVGGSMDDFCDTVTRRGANVMQLREETDGVRRSVVEVTLKI